MSWFLRVKAIKAHAAKDWEVASATSRIKSEAPEHTLCRAGADFSLECTRDCVGSTGRPVPVCAGVLGQFAYASSVEGSAGFYLPQL